MSAQILDGVAVARSVRERVAEGVRELVAGGGPQPGLATVLVGADPASQIYVRRKNEQTAEAGMQSFHHELAATTPQAELDALIDSLNADPAVHGILVQSPLPDGLDEARAFARIDPAKDVDGFHPENVGQLAAQPARAALLHARGRDRAARPLRDRPGGQGDRRRRPLEHRRQAARAAAAAPQRDRHDRALAHARPARGHARAPTC